MEQPYLTVCGVLTTLSHNPFLHASLAARRSVMADSLCHCSFGKIWEQTKTETWIVFVVEFKISINKITNNWTISTATFSSSNMFYPDTVNIYVNLIISLYQNMCVSYICQQYSKCMHLCKCLPLCVGNNWVFLSSSAKKEEEDLEDKKSIKKRIKELKVLDPKIAQNLCKYVFPFSPLLLSRTGFLCVRVSWCHSILGASVILVTTAPYETLCTYSFPFFLLKG